MTRGFLYLVVIMDWVSRAVLAWRLSNTLGAEFCVEVLEEALSRGDGGCAGGDMGEGVAGRRSRSSTYSRAFCFVGLARCAVSQALVLALLTIKAEPGADAGLRFRDAGIGVEIDLLVFEAAPQPLDEDVVHVAALAVHADRDLVALQRAGKATGLILTRRETEAMPTVAPSAIGAGTDIGRATP